MQNISENENVIIACDTNNNFSTWNVPQTRSGQVKQLPVIMNFASCYISPPVTESSAAIIDPIYSTHPRYMKNLIFRVFDPLSITRNIKSVMVINEDHKSITSRCYIKFNKVCFQQNFVQTYIDDYNPRKYPRWIVYHLEYLFRKACSSEKEMYQKGFSTFTTSIVFRRNRRSWTCGKKLEPYRIGRNEPTSLIMKAKKRLLQWQIKRE